MSVPDSSKEPRICEACGIRFLFFAQPSDERYKVRGRFCSRQCWGTWRTTSRPFADRFFAMVGRKTLSGCILWAGRCNRRGYGMIDNSISSRVAYQLMVGPIPDGLFVLHRCDNPPCVNPTHLFLGTHSDNMADMDAKGRRAVGTKSGIAKLTEQKVQEIRQRYDLGQRNQKRLAAMYGVSPMTISLLLRRATWKHITD